MPEFAASILKMVDVSCQVNCLYCSFRQQITVKRGKLLLFEGLFQNLSQDDFDNLKEQLHDLEEKLASEKDKEKEMNEKLRKYVHESEVLQNKLNQQQFGYEKFISDDSKMIFYTGLSRKQFNALWEFIEPELSTPTRNDISQKNELFAVLVNVATLATVVRLIFQLAWCGIYTQGNNTLHILHLST